MAKEGEDPFADIPPPDETAPAAMSAIAPLGLSGHMRQHNHQVIVFFHLVFKVAALFFYTFATWFTESFILAFVVCIILLSCDFWTVKNVTGRLLVGLRWWSKVEDDGAQRWVFESLDDPSAINKQEARIFWWGLLLPPGLWAFLGVIAVLKINFDWVLVPVIATALSAANAYGYIKCRRDAQQRIRQVGRQVGSAIFQRVSTSMFESVVGSDTPSAQGGSQSNV